MVYVSYIEVVVKADRLAHDCKRKVVGLPGAQQ
jgi:hypothetical protein